MLYTQASSEMVREKLLLLPSFLFSIMVGKQGGRRKRNCGALVVIGFFVFFNHRCREFFRLLLPPALFFLLLLPTSDDWITSYTLTHQEDTSCNACSMMFVLYIFLSVYCVGGGGTACHYKQEEGKEKLWFTESLITTCSALAHKNIKSNKVILCATAEVPCCKADQESGITPCLKVFHMHTLHARGIDINTSS